MRILIDDFRIAVNGEKPDIIVRNYNAGLKLIDELGNNDCLRDADLYIDHDLGEEDENKTGYKIMCLIEEQVNGDGDMKYLPKSITCVSDNGPGRYRIQQIIDKLYGGR